MRPGEGSNHVKQQGNHHKTGEDSHTTTTSSSSPFQRGNTVQWDAPIWFQPNALDGRRDNSPSTGERSFPRLGGVTEK